MSRLFNELRAHGQTLKLIEGDIVTTAKVMAAMEQHSHWDAETYQTYVSECEFAREWSNNGEIIYNLSHSLAAMFALTSAPNIEWDKLPHPAFVIQVPRAYLPMKGTIEPESSYLYVRAKKVLIVSDWDTTAISVNYGDDSVNVESFNYEESAARAANFVPDPKTVADMHAEAVRRLRIDKTFSKAPDNVIEEAAANSVRAAVNQVRNSASRISTLSVEKKGLHVLSNRIVANLVAYLSEQKAGSVVRRSNSEQAGTLVNVLPPHDVVVNREFRDAAKDAVNATMSGSVVGLRRAMAHHVRGHYRNQPIGEGRTKIKRIWIHPHRRGSEDFGSVVRRVENLSIPTAPSTN